MPDDHTVRHPVQSLYTPGDTRVTCTCGWTSTPCESAAAATTAAQQHLDGPVYGPTLDVGEA